MCQKIWKTVTSAYIAKKFYRIPYSLLVDIGELPINQQADLRYTTFSQKCSSVNLLVFAESAKLTITSVCFSKKDQEMKIRFSSTTCQSVVYTKRNLQHRSRTNISVSVSVYLFCQKKKSYIYTKRCNLCTTEKFFLISRPHMAILNKRNELVSTCRHRRKFILRYN